MKYKSVLSGVLLILILIIISCAQQTPVINDNDNLIRNADMIKEGNFNKLEIDTFDVDYGTATGYLAQPKVPGIYPGIVMIHEWIGLNDYVKEMARQLAAEGYVVLAVDLYEGKVAKNTTEARELSTKVRNNIPAAVSNMKTAVNYLKELRNNTKKIFHTKIKHYKLLSIPFYLTAQLHRLLNGKQR